MFEGLRREFNRLAGIGDSPIIDISNLVLELAKAVAECYKGPLTSVAYEYGYLIESLDSIGFAVTGVEGLPELRSGPVSITCDFQGGCGIEVDDDYKVVVISDRFGELTPGTILIIKRGSGDHTYRGVRFEWDDDKMRYYPVDEPKPCKF